MNFTQLFSVLSGSLARGIAVLLIGVHVVPFGAAAAHAAAVPSVRYASGDPAGAARTLAAQAASYAIKPGTNGEPTAFISGADAVVTLPAIQEALKVISPTEDLLVENPAKIWTLNISLFIERGVTLQITGDTATWLKLRSQDAASPASSRVLAQAPPNVDYNSFVTIKTYNGMILIDGVKLTSWDPNKNTYDTNLDNGRSFLLAKYDARMDIKNAEVSYLGYAGQESFGLSWRDINDPSQPDVLLTRVTGTVENSTLSYNYYGVYTFQASNMIFRGNKVHHNIGYGFDPHDYSNNFLIENNDMFENGNHGFIISRGCHDFVIRNNKSYNNHYTVSNEDRLAHGFMIDPGSPNSRDPQVPSYNNLLENNQAYGNDGYGLRMLNAISNTIQLNTFTGNAIGITLESGSTGNIIASNIITGSTVHGIYVLGGSDNTTITGNTVRTSGRNGIYIKTGHNSITGNTVTDNGTVEGAVLDGAGIATLRETDVVAAKADLRLPGTQRSLDDDDPTLVTAPTQISDITQNVIAQNTIARNADDGIELKNATATQVTSNTVSENGLHGIYLSNNTTATVISLNAVYANNGHGIRANGVDTFSDTWTKNSVYDNVQGGIATTSGANNDIKAPDLVRTGDRVTGTTLPGAVVELFSDDGGQGRFFEAQLVADAAGMFSITQAWRGTIVSATTTDQNGNSSDLGAGLARGETRTYLPLISQ